MEVIIMNTLKNLMLVGLVAVVACSGMEAGSKKKFNVQKKQQKKQQSFFDNLLNLVSENPVKPKKSDKKTRFDWFDMFAAGSAVTNLCSGNLKTALAMGVVIGAKRTVAKPVWEATKSAYEAVVKTGTEALTQVGENIATASLWTLSHILRIPTNTLQNVAQNLN
jgi:hypothetical protein